MNNFDNIASIYDYLKGLFFGSTLEDLESGLVRSMKPGLSYLVIGGGTGAVIPAIIENFPVSVDYVEKSSKMISLAAKRPGAEVVTFHHCDINDFVPGKYDVIITGFVLDVFNERSLMHVVSQLGQALMPEGIWLYTDFQRTGKIRHKFLIRLMIVFFRLSVRLQAESLFDHHTALKQAGFKLYKEITALKGLVAARVYARRPVTSKVS